MPHDSETVARREDPFRAMDTWKMGIADKYIRRGVGPAKPSEHRTSTNPHQIYIDHGRLQLLPT